MYRVRYLNTYGGEFQDYRTWSYQNAIGEYTLAIKNGHLKEVLLEKKKDFLRGVGKKLCGGTGTLD